MTDAGRLYGQMCNECGATWHDERAQKLAEENARLREALERVDRLIGMNEDDDSLEAMRIIAAALTEPREGQSDEHH